jgi:hypothetical protein
MARPPLDAGLFHDSDADELWATATTDLGALGDFAGVAAAAWALASAPMLLTKATAKATTDTTWPLPRMAVRRQLVASLTSIRFVSMALFFREQSLPPLRPGEGHCVEGIRRSTNSTTRVLCPSTRRVYSDPDGSYYSVNRQAAQLMSG